MKRFFHNARDARRIFDEIAVLDKRLARTGDISFLEYVAALKLTHDLTGDDDKRHRVHVSGGDTGDEI